MIYVFSFLFCLISVSRDLPNLDILGKPEFGSVYGDSLVYLILLYSFQLFCVYMIYLYLVHILIIKDLLYSTANSTQYSVIT